MSIDTKPYVTISKGGSGFYAVILEWVPDAEGYWDIYTTGDGRYASEIEAIPEALEIADAEGIRFIGKGLRRADYPPKSEA